MLLPRLRDLRQDSDLTQEQVAHTLFICRNAYGKYKRGEAHIPLESLVALARYYRVSTEYWTYYIILVCKIKGRKP